MNKKNKFAIIAGIVFLVALFSKAAEAYGGYNFSTERYVLIVVVLPLFIMAHFIYHLKNPSFYENEKEYNFLSVIYKYVFIPACILFTIGAFLLG